LQFLIILATSVCFGADVTELALTGTEEAFSTSILLQPHLV